jgi:hypothetical protein
MMGLLRSLDDLYPPDPQQAEGIEDIITGAFNRLDQDPRRVASILAKALKYFSRRGNSREQAAYRIMGALQDLHPDAGDMFRDFVEGTGTVVDQQRFVESFSSKDEEEMVDNWDIHMAKDAFEDLMAMAQSEDTDNVFYNGRTGEMMFQYGDSLMRVDLGEDYPEIFEKSATRKKLEQELAALGAQDMETAHGLQGKKIIDRDDVTRR